MDEQSFDNSTTSEDELNNIGSDEHLTVADESADKSITLVKNETNSLPLPNDKTVLVAGPDVETV